MAHEFSPLLILRPALWLAVVVVSILLLRRRKVTPGVRLAFIVGGVLVFGFLFAQTATVALQPNPVAGLRTVLTRMFVQVPGGAAGGALLTVLPVVVLLLLPFVVRALFPIAWLVQWQDSQWQLQQQQHYHRQPHRLHIIRV